MHCKAAITCFSIGVLITLANSDCKGQSVVRVLSDTILTPRTYTYVEKMPCLLGSKKLTTAQKEIQLRRYIQANVIFPSNFKKLKGSAKIFYNYTVLPTGQVVNITIIKSDKRLNTECINAVTTALARVPKLVSGADKEGRVTVGITSWVEFGQSPV